jgi:hypothetical protein
MVGLLALGVDVAGKNTLKPSVFHAEPNAADATKQVYKLYRIHSALFSFSLNLWFYFTMFAPKSQLLGVSFHGNSIYFRAKTW